jgi:Mrp family chromosome partitioning ATPase
MSQRHRLLISSASEGEGKTTVTLGLAIALTFLGFRVLVVDGDFRSGELSRRLGYTSSAMVSNSGVIPVMGYPGLDLLPTLPQQDKVIELIARGGFERHLKVAEANGHYDYLLLDSAPISSTREAALISAVASHVLLVTRAGVSECRAVCQTIEQFRQGQHHLVGIVLNGTARSSASLLDHTLFKFNPLKADLPSGIAVK